jgi:hypothetical protein
MKSDYASLMTICGVNPQAERRYRGIACDRARHSV